MAFFSREAEPDTMNDEQLAACARAGNEQAFSLLINRCIPMVKRHASALRSASIEADDLAQEGMMGLMAAVRSYDPEAETSFRTYASVCVRRRMLSALKRASGAREIPASERVSMDDGEEAPLPLASGEEDPAQLVVRKEDVSRLHGRLRQLLTECEYDVLTLYLGAYSYAEIARRLEMNEKAVDNALQRVRRKLIHEPRFGG